MRRLALRLAPFATLLGGCHQDESEDSRPCDYTVEEVAWDSPAIAPEFAVVPRDVADSLSLPVAGELEYLATNTADVVEATPNSGMTSFTSTLAINGTPRLSMVRGASGNELLRCPSTLEFDGTIDFSTGDGFFDEAWAATIVSSPSSFTSKVDLAPDVTEVSEVFDVTRSPGAEEWETASYRHVFSYSSCIGCDNLQISGEITYRGQYPATQDGDIIDQRGFTVTLARWSGAAL